MKPTRTQKTAPLTRGQQQTAAATAARKRARLDRLRPDFLAAGWICIPPEEQGEDQRAAAQPQA